MGALRGPLFGARMILGVSERFSAVCRAAGVTQIRSVPNGLSKIPVVERVTSPDGRVRLAYVGGTTAEKGYLLIRYALQRSSFRHLDLTLVDLTRQKGDVSHEVWGTTPVTIIPKVAQAAVHELYARTDVLVAPSTCVESFGLATREAMALGCWVVASDRGSIGEPVVHGENGFLISVDDLDDLVATLTMLDADPGKFTRPPGRQQPVRTAEDQARDLHAIYDEILSPGRQMAREAAMSVVGSPHG
jgi:glycosyltransferase involved in cell wall biosynthesis